VFCAKSVEAADNKGDDFFGKTKEFAIVTNEEL
jgi:hypothetical protein